MQGLAVVAQGARIVEQAQAAQVQVVDAGVAVATAAAGDEALELGAVQVRHENAALGVLEVLAVGLAHRGAFGGADAEHQQRRPLTAEGLTDALALLGTERGTDQQHPAFAQAALGQQRQALVQRQVGCGMIAGSTASSRLRVVPRSSDSGTSVCALPA